MCSLGWYVVWDSEQFGAHFGWVSKTQQQPLNFGVHYTHASTSLLHQYGWVQVLCSELYCATLLCCTNRPALQWWQHLQIFLRQVRRLLEHTVAEGKYGYYAQG